MAKDGGAYGTWGGLMAGGLGARCSLSGGEAVRARDPWLHWLARCQLDGGQKQWSVRWWGRKRVRAWGGREEGTVRVVGEEEDGPCVSSHGG